MKKVIVRTVIAAALLSVVAACAFAQAPAVELHGYMQNRFYAPPSSSMRFVPERVSLSATGKLADGKTAYVELYIHQYVPSPGDPLYLESAYMDMPIGPGRLRVGKGRQLNFGMTPTYPNRKTSQYGIISETFTMDRIVGAQFNFKNNNIDGGVTVFSDQNINRRKIGDFAGALPNDVIEHFTDKDVPDAISGKMAVAAKIGFSTSCFQAHVSGCTGGLDQASKDYVAAPYGIAAGVNTNRDHSKFGFDGTYASGPFVAQGEWYSGKFSFLKITGWQVLVGYQPKDKQRLYLRYSALDNSPGGGRVATANQKTWNTQQFTVGFVQPISKGVWAEINYERNMAKVPVGCVKPKNDLLFLEIFSGF